MSDPENRRAALSAAVQIVAHGKWEDANHRATGTVRLANYFLEWLEPPPPDAETVQRQAVA